MQPGGGTGHFGRALCQVSAQVLFRGYRFVARLQLTLRLYSLKCHYCGLSDTALGSPLLRVPDEKEWREHFPRILHNKTTYMVAEISQGIQSAHYFVASPPSKVLTVRVRVGGELVSSEDTSEDSNSKNVDAAMQQFLPRNSVGFQSELKFRSGAGMSFISGSLSAHESCAMAAHKSRKEKVLTERRNFIRHNMTCKSALLAGKTSPLGKDPWGRTYWVFSGEPTSLFVCETDPSTNEQKWRKFGNQEEVAAVMVCLKRGPLLEVLKDVFPKAARSLRDNSWSTILYERSLSKPANDIDSPKGTSEAANRAETEELGPVSILSVAIMCVLSAYLTHLVRIQPFVEDEDVLVESENGKFLWDAVIVEVSKDPESDRVNGYLVHYKNWSSRFDQWVSPDRVVETSEVNLEIQDEVLHDFSTANDSTPAVFQGLFANSFLNGKKRARGSHVVPNEIFETATPRPGSSNDEKMLGELKSALLLIEASLPRGSVGLSLYGSWSPQAATAWHNLVKDALGPETLMKLVLVLEEAISNDWKHAQATQLYGSLPKLWRAQTEASLPSVALRVSVLDRCVKYSLKKSK